jgi:hypothetical protein
MKLDRHFLGIHLFLAEGTSPYAMRAEVQIFKAHNTEA